MRRAHCRARDRGPTGRIKFGTESYPEPDMFGRLPAYALFARHLIGFDMRDADFSYEKEEARPAVQLRDVVRVDTENIRAQKPGADARELLKPIHLAKAEKETF